MAGKGFSLVGFAEAARRHGLPTKFIERVHKEYVVTTSFATDEDTTTRGIAKSDGGQFFYRTMLFRAICNVRAGRGSLKMIQGYGWAITQRTWEARPV